MKKLFTIALILFTTIAFAQTKKDTAQVLINIGSTMLADSSSLYWSTHSTAFNVSQTPRSYQVNWKKVKTFNDLKEIMQMFNIIIYDNAANFNKIRKYLIIAK